jgi:hypothetical protein
VIRNLERWNICREKTFACRENVSVWTELQTDKIGNDILETLGNVTVCTLSLFTNSLKNCNNFNVFLFQIEQYYLYVDYGCHSP